MSYAILQKENLNRFIIGLAENIQVVAPIYQEYHSYAFEEVRTAERIAVTYIPTILPPKKYCAPQHETLIQGIQDHFRSVGIIFHQKNVHQVFNHRYSFRSELYNLLLYLHEKKKLSISKSPHLVLISIIMVTYNYVACPYNLWHHRYSGGCICQEKARMP